MGIEGYALSGLELLSGDSQGVALGYSMSPFQGFLLQMY